MKYATIFFALCWLMVGYATHATSLAPTDTLPGHARLVRALSATLCTELSSPQAPDLSKLPTAGVMQYAQGLFTTAMQRDSAQVLALLEKAAAQGIQPAEAARQLGHDAMLTVAKNCPAARPLALRLAQTEPGQQALAAQKAKLPPAEQKALQPVANALCATLNASNAHTPFANLTAAGRKQVLMRSIQKAFKPNTAALTRFYGPARLDALLRSGEFDGRVASLMLGQNMCTEYILLVGSDRLAEKDAKP